MTLVCAGAWGLSFVRVEVRSEDVRALPFPDATFDVVLSNLCLHNIPAADGREQACREIARVLKPDGRVVLADAFHVSQYARVFRELGMQVSVRRAPFLEAATPWHRILVGRRSDLAYLPAPE